MKIIIDIPDCFNNNPDAAMINIEGKNFLYDAPDNRHYGLQCQFSQIDKLKEDKLKKQCMEIERAIRVMLKEYLL